MFELYNEVFKKAKNLKKSAEKIEAIRKENLSNPTVLTIDDLGAGSTISKSKQRSVKEITRNTSKSKKHVRFLAQLCNYLKSKTIIECGTSVGFTSMYLANTNQESNIITIEGSESIAQIAQQNFHKSGLKNIDLHVGNFDEVLPTILTNHSFDLLFIDGNHTYEATLRYFNLAKSKRHNYSVIVFDDIYWNEDMTKAWEEIKKDVDVTATIDLFEFGIVFFREGISKQDFVLRY